RLGRTVLSPATSPLRSGRGAAVWPCRLLGSGQRPGRQAQSARSRAQISHGVLSPQNRQLLGSKGIGRDTGGCSRMVCGREHTGGNETRPCVPRPVQADLPLVPTLRVETRVRETLFRRSGTTGTRSGVPRAQAGETEFRPLAFPRGAWEGEGSMIRRRTARRRGRDTDKGALYGAVNQATSPIFGSRPSADHSCSILPTAPSADRSHGSNPLPSGAGKPTSIPRCSKLRTSWSVVVWISSEDDARRS